MDWTFLSLVALGIFIVANSVMDYLTNKEINKLKLKVCDLTNQLDSLDRRCIHDLRLTDEKHNFIKNKVLGVEDNLKYMYLDKKDIYAMWDIHNARVNGYFEDMMRESSNINRLLPLLPLAEKFEIKRKLKHNKAYADDLKFDLKEVERELKELA